MEIIASPLVRGRTDGTAPTGLPGPSTPDLPAPPTCGGSRMSFATTSNGNEGDSYVRRQAKATFADSNPVAGNSRGLLGRAFAPRGAFRDADGSGAPSGRLLLLALAIGCLAVLLLVPAAQAGKVPGFGVLGTGTVGGGTGQIGESSQGLAVNTTGAGGVPAGSVYVSDSANRRISQFSGDGAFVRSWGWDVVASGEHNTGANEQQKVTVRATGGSFRLTVTTVIGSGSVTEGSNQITNIQPSLGTFHVGDVLNLGFGIPEGTTVTGVSGSTLTISNNATDTFPSAFALTGRETTANISATATAAEVEAALEALPGVGDVTVTGGPGDAEGSDPYQVTFSDGPLSHNDVEMTATDVDLTGGSSFSSVEASTQVAGGGYEICEAESSPVDVCKRGVEKAVAGGLSDQQGLTVDPATGNVFVVSNGNKRIDVFSATGQFQGAFGWNVNATSPEEQLQFCTLATGCQEGSAGSAASQFGAMAGEAGAGSSPALSPVDGHLYVPEPGNRRISVFSLTLSGSEVTGAAFIKAFGPDVVPTVNEVQTVTLNGATGGTFALSFGGKSTDTAGTGDLEAGSNEVTNFKANDRAFVAGEQISGPGIPAGTRITAVTFDSLTLSNAATATATGVTFDAALPFDARVSTVQKAFQGLSSIGSGNVSVSGSDGGPYTIEFTGKFAGEDLAQITADASKLTGTTPSVAIATTQDGANGPGTGLETCTVATGCKVGADEFTSGISPPSSLAIDSEGSIYAAGHPGFCVLGGCGVQKFNASATSVEPFAPDQLSAAVLVESTKGASRLVAVDPANDHVLVVKKVSPNTFKIFEFTRSGSFIDSSPPGEAGLLSSGGGSSWGPQGFIVGTADRAYYLIPTGGRSTEPPGRILGIPPAPKATVESPSAISQTKATFTGVAEPSPPGLEGGFATVAWFEYSSDNVAWTATDAIEIGNGSGAGNPNTCPVGNPPSCNISQTVGGLKGGTTYLVRLVVSNGTKTVSSPVTFSTPAAGPGISGLAATEVTQTQAALNGDLEPNGQVTSYHFEWGLTSAYGNRVPGDLEAIAGGGSQPIPVSVQISGLQPATTYHYRIVAKSSSGTTTSSDQELMTLNSLGLPSNRGIELVSPANKEPVGDVNWILNAQLHFQVAEEGDGVAYPILNGLASSNAGGELIFRGARTASGWTNQQVSAPALIPAQTPSVGASDSGKLRAFSSNLACGLVMSHNPLTADTPPVSVENGVKNLYLWSATVGSYRLVTERPPLDPTATDSGGSYYQVAGVTPDCSRVFFRSFYSFIPGASGFYEWDNGTLRDAGLRPDGSVSNVGDRVALDRYTVSRNGRAFFMATSNEAADNGKQAVFVRKGPGEVVNASKPVNGNPTQGALYQGASPDGAHVFFTANYGIAATSSHGPTDEECVPSIGGQPAMPNGACDLYRYDVESGALIDISANTDSANPRGAVVLGVVDISEDGETVYFAARGQLVPGEGPTYAQNLNRDTASVYRYRDGDIRYVASISMDDTDQQGVNDVGGVLLRSTIGWEAQTTKDGEFLAFSSTVNLAGSNPKGLSRVYLYSSQTGATECVSCPRGRTLEKDAHMPSPNGLEDIWGTYSPRGLSEDGRVFFTSADPLAPGAIQGGEGNLGLPATTNAYEWHRGQLSLVASGQVRLLGIGDDGRDAFVRSYDQLVPEDIDFAADVYDLRIDSPGFTVPPKEVPCDPAADQCQGAPAVPPAAPNPASFHGSGNPAPEKPKANKCRKGKVRKHGKCVKKKHGKKKKTKKARAHKRAAGNDLGGAK